MFTYQARPRVLRMTGEQKSEFPADVEIVFYLQPLQPFGGAAGGGLTTVRSRAASVFFNANTGQHFVESKSPLEPLDVQIEEPNRVVALKGNRVTLKQRCQDHNNFTELIWSLYFGIPVLLGIEFADPPIVERVEGRIGKQPFRWELLDWRVELDITTQERQQERFVTAWNRFGTLSHPQRRRLIAATHYFHVACRLRREGKAPGEFMPEALLNFNKVLEVLYGPNRDLTRNALSGLGYEAEEIERDFIPSMLFRNSIDVGHPMLALFTPRQLETLHRYSDRAERVFRDFLQRLFNAIEAGRLEVEPHDGDAVDRETHRIIDALQKRLDALGDRP